MLHVVPADGVNVANNIELNYRNLREASEKTLGALKVMLEQLKIFLENQEHIKKENFEKLTSLRTTIVALENRLIGLRKWSSKSERAKENMLDVVNDIVENPGAPPNVQSMMQLLNAAQNLTTKNKDEREDDDDGRPNDGPDF